MKSALVMKVGEVVDGRGNVYAEKLAVGDREAIELAMKLDGAIEPDGLGDRPRVFSGFGDGSLDAARGQTTKFVYQKGKAIPVPASALN